MKNIFGCGRNIMDKIMHVSLKREIHLKIKIVIFHYLWISLGVGIYGQEK